MKNDTWEALRFDCENCVECELGMLKTNCVFGTGNTNADVLFVGEAPGDNEDKTGIPFVGRAGKLLDEFLFAVDIDRDSVYIANILKCRPPNNRDPLPIEEDACIGYLRRQVKLINPKVIVCLGRISAAKLIRPDYKISKEHGTFVRKGGFCMTAVYHPAYLLRNPSKKAEMLEDMKKIKALIEEIK